MVTLPRPTRIEQVALHHDEFAIHGCSSGPAVRIAGVLRGVNSDAHQPEVAIWSAVRKDDTNRPTVGNSHSATSTTTEMWTPR
jgi:hypothetical protein